MHKRNKTCLVVGIALFMCAPVVVSAQIPLEVGLGDANSVSGLGEYISTIYRFTVGLAGILAAVMIMYAGLLWAAAAGNSEKVGEAKERLVNAIMGLTLALISFVLLNTINDALVTFRDAPTPRINFPEDLAGTGAVSLSGAAPAGEPQPEAIRCEANEVLVDFTKPGVIPTNLQENWEYIKLNSTNHPCANPAAVNSLINAIALAENRDMQIVVTSAYRSNSTTYHGEGEALDVGWRPLSGGLYVDIVGQIGESHIDWHNFCVCNTADDPKCTQAYRGTNSCTTEHVDSVKALNQAMISSGFSMYCKEWWHHQTAGTAATCAAGVYQYNDL